MADQVGTVTQGKYADIIAVRGDVLRHIDLLQRVDITMKHGEQYRWHGSAVGGPGRLCA